MALPCLSPLFPSSFLPSFLPCPLPCGPFRLEGAAAPFRGCGGVCFCTRAADGAVVSVPELRRIAWPQGRARRLVLRRHVQAWRFPPSTWRKLCARGELPPGLGVLSLAGPGLSLLSFVTVGAGELAPARTPRARGAGTLPGAVVDPKRRKVSPPLSL